MMKKKGLYRMMALLFIAVLLLAELSPSFCVYAMDPDEQDSSVNSGEDYTEEDDTEESVTADLPDPDAEYEDVLAGGSMYTVSVKYSQTDARTFESMINEFRKGEEAWYKDQNGNKVKVEGLGELKYDHKLETVAMLRAAETAVMFSHTRPNGDSCFSAYYDPYGSGENLAAGRTTAKATMDQWKETDRDYSGQGHRRNMLNKDFKSVAVGHVIFNGTHYWAMALGKTLSGESESPARDGEVDVQIQISDSFISGTNINPSLKDGSTIELTPDTEVELPGFTAQISVKDHWPSGKISVKGLSVEWSLSDNEFAEIIDGKVRAKKYGSCKLTADVKFAGKTSSYKYTLKAKDPDAADPSETKPRNLKKSVKVEKLEAVVYSGNEYTPEVIVTDKKSGERLKLNTEYSVEYKNNIKAGSAKVIIKGIPEGGYTGTVKKSFKILKHPVDAAAVEYGKTVMYLKGGAVPEIKVTVDGRVLNAGEDFKIKLKGNKAAGSESAVFVIKGKGSYKGKTMEYPFEIIQKPVDRVEAKANDVKFKASGGSYRTKIVLKDSNGSRLTAGKDYEKKYDVFYAQDCLVNNGNISHKDGDPVEPGDIVPSGTALKARITAKGNYSGEVYVFYSVIPGKK